MTDETLSAAQRMALFAHEMRLEKSGLSDFWSTLPYFPDPYQEEALEAVAYEQSVLVSAPTGAGKTVVGEGAAYLARRKGRRIFYTTPIKALSNQKFRDFQKMFGDVEVGLLTGDTSINPHAPIVVMTTEVLRNMIYAGNDLSNLGVVVLDEVHYLSDRFRGPVWEEVLIQLPTDVQVVALSATLSNAKDFGGWMQSVRGTCEVIVSSNRPVPLYQHMMVGPRLYDLYAAPTRAARSKNPSSFKLNPELLHSVSEIQEFEGTRPLRRGREIVKNGRRPRPVSRKRVLEVLAQRKMLPAIVFIFSRAGCDEAAASASGYRLNLTTAFERAEIRAEAEATLASIPVADHGALGLHQWAYGLEEGVAAHHAGLLPQLKEAVERLFTRGLIKVVFATETLALGINMPAKTVVLESLEKWNGSEHLRLSPREYTQLTGRAGRRGIDIEGHAVVLERGVVTPEEVASLASGRSYPLNSAFHPNYNMAVNLLSRASLEDAKQILESSFAQYQADASIVKLAQKLRRANAELDKVKATLQCERGDALEYFDLREQVSGLQKEASKLTKAARKMRSSRALERLRLGDVVSYQRGRRSRFAVVVSAPSPGFDTPLARIVGDDGKPATLGPREADLGIEVITRIHVPNKGARRPKERSSLALQVREIAANARYHSKKGPRDPRVDRLLDAARRLEDKVRTHPVHNCPDREMHASVGHQYVRLLRERDQVAEQINSRTAYVVEDFERVCAVLRHLNFLNGDSVTNRGETLRRIFGERDLLITQAIANGAWRGLSPEELAAIVSTVVYEPRGDDATNDGAMRMPTGALQLAWDETNDAYFEIRSAELKQHREVTSAPSADLVDVIYRWARGASLTTVLDDTELSGGDFVRWVRQVLDMLNQFRHVDNEELRHTAAAARKKLLHGVVVWSEFS